MYLMEPFDRKIIMKLTPKLDCVHSLLLSRIFLWSFERLNKIAWELGANDKACLILTIYHPVYLMSRSRQKCLVLIFCTILQYSVSMAKNLAFTLIYTLNSRCLKYTSSEYGLVSVQRGQVKTHLIITTWLHEGGQYGFWLRTMEQISLLYIIELLYIN